MSTIDLEEVHVYDWLNDQHQPPLNRINPISPTNPRGDGYMDAAQDYLNRNGGG